MNPRKMPTKSAIQLHWAEWLIQEDKFDDISEVLSGYYCFACGMDYGGGLIRAHILARCDGGTDDLSNIHLLCETCHHASDGLSGDVYFKWLKRMGFANVFQGLAMMRPDLWPEGKMYQIQEIDTWIPNAPAS